MLEKMVDHGVPFVLGGILTAATGALALSNGFARLDAKMDLMQQRTDRIEVKLDNFIIKSGEKK
jgi:hypothetical protein